MKILLTQLNYHIANFGANRAKMESFIREGIKKEPI